MNWNTFFKRLATAVVFCGVMLFGLMWDFSTFLILTLWIQFLCVKEFLLISQKLFPDSHFPKWLTAIAQLSAAALCLSALLFTEDTYIALSIIALIPIIILSLTILQKKNTLQAGVSTLTALLYIALPMALYIGLFMIQSRLPLVLILIIWTNDTMAYITGSFIGRTPLSAISPKKTWEGTIGGVIFTLGVVWLINKVLHWFPEFGLYDLLAIAIGASVSGIIGDLFESKLKRIAGIKDSGSIMPGHGGALDRFDSLLFAVPVVFVYAVIFYPMQ